MKLTEEDLKLKAKQDVRADMAPMHRLVSDIKHQARQGMRWNEDKPRDGTDQMQNDCWGKSGTRIVDAMLEQAESRGCTKRETKMSKFLKPSQKPKEKSQASSRPQEKSQDPGSEPAGKSATPRGATAPGKTAALNSGSEDRGPKLKAAQYQDHAGLGAQSNFRPHQSKLATRPVKEAASGTQRSWKRVWTHLHHMPGQQQQLTLEMGLQGYFQNAQASLSAHGTLVHGSEQSRMHVHESMRNHQTALKSNHKGQASP